MNYTWLSFMGTIIAALIIATSAVFSVQLGFHQFRLEQEAKRKEEILQERKVALFDALHVIDLIYANLRFNNVEPLNPTKFDINIARNAINKMLVYCEDPQKTVTAFYKAIGMHNPDIEAVQELKVEYLDEFRKQVARELNLPEFKTVDPKKIWIYSLPGTKEAEKLAERKQQAK